VADFPQPFSSNRAKWNQIGRIVSSRRIVRRRKMPKLKLFAGLAALAAVAIAPSVADARHYRHHHRHHWQLPYHISYLHNYGPGLTPGTFAYYDGPATNRCYQSAAAYLGQDGRRHPCN
jgi:hypothetical protein